MGKLAEGVKEFGDATTVHGIQYITNATKALDR